MEERAIRAAAKWLRPGAEHLKPAPNNALAGFKVGQQFESAAVDPTPIEPIEQGPPKEG